MKSLFQPHFAALPLLCALPAWADSAAPPLPAAGSGIFQVALGLAVVLALFWGSLQVLKRLQTPRSGTWAGLRVVGATAVGPRERIVVVEIGETWLVVGVAPGQVTSLGSVPRQETPPLEMPANRDFGAWLKHVMERKKNES